MSGQSSFFYHDMKMQFRTFLKKNIYMSKHVVKGFILCFIRLEESYLYEIILSQVLINDTNKFICVKVR